LTYNIDSLPTYGELKVKKLYVSILFLIGIFGPLFLILGVSAFSVGFLGAGFGTAISVATGHSAWPHTISPEMFALSAAGNMVIIYATFKLVPWCWQRTGEWFENVKV